YSIATRGMRRTLPVPALSGRGRGSCADLAVQVDPAPVLPGEPADLVQAATAGLIPVMCRELDRAGVVEGATAFGALDLEEQPALIRVEFQGFRAGAPMPGAAQIVDVADGESGITRAHQCLGGRRVTLTGQYRRAAAAERFTAPARAGLRLIHDVDHAHPSSLR